MPKIANQKSDLLAEVVAQAGTINYKVWWDAENMAVRHWSKGLNDQQLAEDSVVEVVKFLDEHPASLGVTVDLREVTRINAAARKIFAEFVKGLDKKVVFYGGNRIIRVVVKIIFGVSGRDSNMKFVASEDEALSWLKNNE